MDTDPSEKEYKIDFIDYLPYKLGSAFVKLFCCFFKKNKPNQKVIKPNIYTKNKWLYPMDNFGVMEKGVVYES